MYSRHVLDLSVPPSVSGGRGVLKRIVLSFLLFCTALRAHFAQNLFDLETQEIKYRHNMLWDKDVEILQEILAIWSSRMGANSLGVAQYSSRLGTALMQKGDYPGAEQALQTALSILESNGPAYDQAGLTVKRKLVKVLNEQNKTDQADRLQSSLPAGRAKVQFDTAPQVIFKEQPQYTNAAAAKDVSGFILLSLIVDAAGHATDIHVIEPLGFGLDESAIKAVEQWKFKPATQTGFP